MKIGVVSDTHNNLKNVRKIVELFNANRVERVIHTGDISQAKTLDALAELDAPLWGVFGNNDQERDSLLSGCIKHGFQFQDPPLVLDWHNRQIIVVHDPLEFDGHLHLHHELALHGHTHRHRDELEGQTRFFNPGECAGHMRGLNQVGIVDLKNLNTEILKF